MIEEEAKDKDGEKVLARLGVASFLSWVTASPEIRKKIGDEVSKILEAGLSFFQRRVVPLAALVGLGEGKVPKLDRKYWQRIGKKAAKFSDAFDEGNVLTAKELGVTPQEYNDIILSFFWRGETFESLEHAPEVIQDFASAEAEINERLMQALI